MSTKNLTCPSCRGLMQYDDYNEVYECPFCGYKEKIEDSDQVRIEKIRANTQRDIEMTRENNRIKAEKERKEEEGIAAYKKGKLSKFTIAFAIICLLFMFVSFSQKHILPGLIALIQTGLFSVSWLSGMHIIKEKFRSMHVVLAIVGFVLIIPFALTSGGSDNKKKEDVRVSVPDIETEQIVEEKEPIEDAFEIEESAAIEKTESYSEDETSKEKDEPESENEEEESTDAVLLDGMRAEFKESMDSYEAFFDEYVDFMKKYTEKPENAISMLGEYTEMMVKYTDAMEKMDKLGDEDLNDAELKYYIEVTGRINQKLLSVSMEQ